MSRSRKDGRAGGEHRHGRWREYGSARLRGWPPWGPEAKAETHAKERRESASIEADAVAEADALLHDALRLESETTTQFPWTEDDHD